MKENLWNIVCPLGTIGAKTSNNIHCSWDYYFLLLKEPSHGYFVVKD